MASTIHFLLVGIFSTLILTILQLWTVCFLVTSLSAMMTCAIELPSKSQLTVAIFIAIHVLVCPLTIYRSPLLAFCTLNVIQCKSCSFCHLFSHHYHLVFLRCYCHYHSHFLIIINNTLLQQKSGQMGNNLAEQQRNNNNKAKAK